MSSPASCPKCESEDIYNDGALWICPICSHEWDPSATKIAPEAQAAEAGGVLVVCDANGNVLADGDSVIVVKDLKIKGASSSIKAGTKVRGIRLVEATDGHNIACKIDGVGAIHLKSEFVRKS